MKKLILVIIFIVGIIICNIVIDLYVSSSEHKTVDDQPQFPSEVGDK